MLVRIGSPSIVTVLILFIGQQAALAQGPAATAAQGAPARTVVTAPGDLAGAVTYSDVTTPAAKVPVRLWSVRDGEFLLQATTDAKGGYSLGRVESGRYLAVFADRVVVDLRVRDGATVSRLDVVVPKGRAVFAQMPQERRAALLTVLSAGDGTEEGTSDSGLLEGAVIGGGTAAVIVTGLVLHNRGGHGDDGKHLVSP